MNEALNKTPEALVANISHLVSLPDVYIKLDETLKNSDHSRNDVIDIINIDPALCARILRVINSSYYTMPSVVKSISTAVNFLGEHDLHNMVLVTSIANSFDALINEDFDIRAFWQHSIRCGIAAKLFAELKNMDDPNELFLGGLLHDLGQLIIYQHEPELSETVEWHMNHEGNMRYQVEQTLLGFDHARVGGLLTKSWGLPNSLCEMVECHHRPELSVNNKSESNLIQQADLLVHQIDIDAFINDEDSQLKQIEDIAEIINELGIEQEDFIQLVKSIGEQSQAIEDSIMVKGN